MARKKRSVWTQFESPDDYELVDIGRPAVFFIPLKKLRKKVGNETVRSAIDNYLVNTFSTFTKFKVESFGVWRNGRMVLVPDRCLMYEVSFLGKERIKPLLKEIARINMALGEDCIYFKAGQYSSLIYPPKLK
jgi:hypothetical protein